MKKFTSKTQKLGELGEDIACMFLMKHGFEIMERNFTRRYGEIDIIAKKNNLIHFIEVKSVSRESIENVPHETNTYKPEDNLHEWKLKRLSRTIQAYLLEKNYEGEWQFDLVSVFIDVKNKKTRVEMIENITLV